MKLKIALAGNPNSGKTTLFNALTGANQYVGNWPGVTVEKKSGAVKHGKHQLELVDLPGIYSLSPYSIEEKVARNYIIEEKPDVIISIVDATNIERNLYLTMQIFELERPVVIALNMMDEVRKKGDSIDVRGIEKELGVPVIPISAKNKTGLSELVEAAVKVAEDKTSPSVKIFSRETDAAIESLESVITKETGNKLWYAIKLLENDAVVLAEDWVTDDIKAEIQRSGKAIGEDTEERESRLAEERYDFITGMVARTVKKQKRSGELTTSDKIDNIVTNRVLALPIFILFMLLLFQLSFGTISVYLAGVLEGLFENLGEAATEILTKNGANDFVIGLVTEGAIGGIGGIVPFFPPIALMFLFMTILEDSGYMARAAFIMDKLFRRFGLSGKSFIPMLMGFGCSAPAIMAARTLENERDRRLTIMLTPFMSCGARLPIYALFAGVFFPGKEGLIVFSMYMLGIVVAIVSGILLKGTLFAGEVAPFIIELPPYRFPGLWDMWLHVWEKLKDFIYRAGTIIVAVTILIWLTSTYSFSLEAVSDSADSMLAFFGGIIAPLFSPLGFGNWQSTAALITGFAAKEAVVGTMAVLFGASGDVSDVLPQYFTQLSAVSFMVFSLLYLPCSAAFMTIRSEMGSWKWTWISVGYMTGVAWGLSFIVYQVGSIIGF